MDDIDARLVFVGPRGTAGEGSVIVGIFAAHRRRSQPSVAGTGEGSLPEVQWGLPPRFEAIAEALGSGSDFVNACSVVGQRLAHDGTSIEEVLAGLRETWRACREEDPPYEAVTATLGAWSDATLSYLNRLSCNDPLTGLSSQTHLRTCLSDLYRRGGDVSSQWALVVCELPAPEGRGVRMEQALEIAAAGEHVRTVFPHDGAVSRVGALRLATLARRDERLGRRVRLLRMLLNEGMVGDSAEAVLAGSAEQARVRVWIEGLPSGEGAVGMLVDDLAR